MIVTQDKLSPKQKWERNLFKRLQSIGLEKSPSCYGGKSAEMYLCGFATVQVSIGWDNVTVERYYDNERFDDKAITRQFPIDESTFPDADAIVTLAGKLVRTIRNDEPLFNFDEN